MVSAIWCYMPTEKKSQAGKPESETTKQVRIFVDLAEKITDLADLLETSSAQVCDEYLRADIEEQWEQHRPQIERMRALKRQQDELRLEVKNKAKPKRKA